MAKNRHKKIFFCPKGKKRHRPKASAEGRSPPQELEEGPRSGPHLLVSTNVTDSGTNQFELGYCCLEDPSVPCSRTFSLLISSIACKIFRPSRLCHGRAGSPVAWSHCCLQTCQVGLWSSHRVRLHTQRPGTLHIDMGTGQDLCKVAKGNTK